MTLPICGPFQSVVDYSIAAISQSFVDSYEDSVIEAIPALKNHCNGYRKRIPYTALQVPPWLEYMRVDNDHRCMESSGKHQFEQCGWSNDPHQQKKREGLNVDVVARKSVNAIRPFLEKGIMVWGLRTLAGNDNEWRLHPGEAVLQYGRWSPSKTTEQFVFEPNDRKHLGKGSSYDRKFLILQWRAGALAGAKPDQAFYVRVGLGRNHDCGRHPERKNEHWKLVWPWVYRIYHPEIFTQNAGILIKPFIKH